MTAPPTVLVATTNPGKWAELAHGLDTLAQAAAVSLRVLAPRDVGITADVAEVGDDFESISLAKARRYHELSGLPSVADDGGLEIRALGGAPGVRSRRWAGPDGDDDSLIATTLERLRSVEDRAARLRTCVTWWPGGDEAPAQCCRALTGVIAREPCTSRTPGYPYRALFILDGVGKYYDALDAAEHARLNHRLAALSEVFRSAILPWLHAR